MAPVIRLDKVTKRFGAETALTRSRWKCRPAWCSPCWEKTGRARPPPFASCWAWPKPTSGQAQVLGLSSAKQGLHIRQRVGYVPERPTLYEWMTVEEIGWFTAGFYGPGFLPEYSRLAAAVRPAAAEEAQSAFEGHARQGGALAGAGAQPELLMLDEPTSGLDAHGAARVPGKHGGSGRGGADRFSLQPSDRRGGAGGRHRGHPPQGTSCCWSNRSIGSRPRCAG